jgi:hypothetical protein
LNLGIPIIAETPLGAAMRDGFFIIIWLIATGCLLLVGIVATVIAACRQSRGRYVAMTVAIVFFVGTLLVPVSIFITRDITATPRQGYDRLSAADDIRESERQIQVMNITGIVGLALVILVAVLSGSIVDGVVRRSTKMK